MQQHQWHHFNTVEELVDTAVAGISDIAERTIKEKGVFHLSLAGGSTPAVIYQRLVTLDTDWSKWHIWFGDERCLPIGDPDRNDSMAKKSWLDHVPVPASNMHSIPAERGAEQAATDYSAELDKAGEFDLVLLGLGEDGHTASLFPGHDWEKGQESVAAIPVYDAPKPPPDRVSMSAVRLSNARYVWFIVTGESKVDAMQRWRKGESIPAASISADSSLEIYTDVSQDLL
jgi:6-phosphogluconolactonase